MFSILLYINQSINQSINQPINQPIHIHFIASFQYLLLKNSQYIASFISFVIQIYLDF